MDGDQAIEVHKVPKGGVPSPISYCRVGQQECEDFSLIRLLHVKDFTFAQTSRSNSQIKNILPSYCRF